MTFESDFLVRFLSIAIINIALSGDNVIVIGMAAASLPPAQRRLAIIGGGALAVLLRIGLTLVAAMLLQIPLLSAIAGLVLFWVAWGLLKADAMPSHGADRSSDGIKRAVQLIVVADVTMSLDNVLAVAGTANGDVALLTLGLIISMPLLMVSGGALALLINRYRWIVYLGAAVICFTGGRMILETDPVRASFGLTPAAVGIASLLPAVGLPLLFRRLGRHPSEGGRPGSVG